MEQTSAPNAHGASEFAFVSDEELGKHFARRFESFEAEGSDSVGRIEERRQSLHKHYENVRGVDALQREVERLQRRISEIDIQGARERLRALHFAAENSDLDLRQIEQRVEVQQLFEAGNVKSTASAIDPSSLRVSLGTTGPSRCTTRAVVSPNDGGGSAIPSRASLIWNEIQGEVAQHGQELDAFDVEHAAFATRQDEAVHAVREEIAQTLSQLEADQDRLADNLVGYVRLRYQHVAVQRRYAEDVEALKSCAGALTQQSRQLLKRAKVDAQEVEHRAQREALQHTEFYQNMEQQDIHDIDALSRCVAMERKRSVARAAGLADEILELKGKCKRHRQQRRFALDGLKSDLSLLGKKLSVLEAVAVKMGDCVADFDTGYGVGDQASEFLTAAGFSGGVPPGLQQQQQRKSRSGGRRGPRNPYGSGEHSRRGVGRSPGRPGLRTRGASRAKSAGM